MSSPRAVVALVPREVFSTTRRSLERLIRVTRKPYDLVIVDGASPRPVARYLQETANQNGFALIRTDRLLSPNVARNLATRWALENSPADHVVFVDNDVLTSPGWLEALVRCADETGAGVVGPAYYEHLPERTRVHTLGGECGIDELPDGARVLREVHEYPHTPLADVPFELTRRRTELIEFHTVLVARKVFDRIGLLDEKLLCFAEHTDLCLQARGAGFEVWTEPESAITYVPPRKLHRMDRRFFFLRWSEAWTRATRERLFEKYRLTPTPYGPDDNFVNWVRAHRRYGLSGLGRLKRIGSPELQQQIEQQVVVPMEVRWNEWRFPTPFHGRAPQPVVSIVHGRVSRSALQGLRAATATA